MMMEERKELVGKRFLCVSGGGKLKFSRISEWEWKSGVIRAVSHKPEDQKHPDFSCVSTPMPSHVRYSDVVAALQSSSNRQEWGVDPLVPFVAMGREECRSQSTLFPNPGQHSWEFPLLQRDFLQAVVNSSLFQYHYWVVNLEQPPVVLVFRIGKAAGILSLKCETAAEDCKGG
ncbi:Lysine-specific demethylase 3B [Branchiostoma belcheri]|nr:Lysine-specific demethylase 3B [Branchiostoma belcheri]